MNARSLEEHARNALAADRSSQMRAEGSGIDRTDRRAVVVFARAPEAGRVKTRLAAAVGNADALAVYRRLGEQIVGAVSGSADHRTVVAFTPRGSEAAMRGWLGDVVELEPQAEGDLGERMLAAVAARHAAGATRILVVGTDCPAVDATRIAAGFAALDEAEVVLGPALDGGYYLIGVRAPEPALFAGMPWSSPEILARTLDRARAAGLSVRLLPEARDIDTLADLEAWYAALGGPFPVGRAAERDRAR